MMTRPFPLSRLLRSRFPRPAPRSHATPAQLHRPRSFHPSRSVAVVKPFLLADVGEGIMECQLIQWFVQPGARVEQFDKLCEVQSDKASVEISSPFDGVVRKLHYEPDDMAITGRPLIDIDVAEDIAGLEADTLAGQTDEGKDGVPAENGGQATEEQGQGRQGLQGVKGTHATLATPAVRHLTKELEVDIAEVQGTGRDGRVLKADVYQHVEGRRRVSDSSRSASLHPTDTTGPHSQSRADKKMPLSPVQHQMFKAMTASLQIPHFLYTSSADMSEMTLLRKRLNATATDGQSKLTHLPFILKALSLALQHHPLLNSHLDLTAPHAPQLTYKAAHHFGVAMDAPAGLLVPVLRDVQDRTILEIASELRRLAGTARNKTLAPADVGGATFTVSNVGSIGGGVVAPVISAPQVAILGVGRSRVVPAFDERMELVKREELLFSWSADHRVVDGAECARCGERMRAYVEEPGRMVAGLR